ncbi:MAG: poly-gamma-glutamate synthase PgsB [Sphaerochaetaceae bacterium]|nr:poly-gamma-glutamate synthase PgsB [Sphaerochaetaceae bacterium]
MVLCIVLTLALLALGVVESIVHQKNLKRIKIRILVNGTRGKTTTAKLLVAAMNEGGIRTLGRTTGSEAQILFPDGHVEPFVRKRGASILEMKSLFRLAVKENVEAVVVECMALRPENQSAIAKTLVKPTHVVITNTYIDHIPEMGDSIKQTAYVMGLSVPAGAKLFVTEPHYENLKAEIHQVEASQKTIEGSVPIHAENYALAKAVLDSLHIGPEALENGAKTIVPDVGLHESFTAKGGAFFVPTFSVNDLTCMKQTVEKAVAENEGKRIWLIFNNRSDREYRILLMDRVIRCYKEKLAGVYCIGEYTWKVSRHFARTGVPVLRSSAKELFEILTKATEQDMFIGLGNIKGEGESLVDRFVKEVN